MKSKELKNLTDIFTEFTEYISSIFSVIHSNVKINLNLLREECEIPKFSLGIENTFYTHDLLIFPLLLPSLDKDVLAQAWPCITLSSNKKAIVGVVEINPHFSLKKFASSYYMKYPLFHEISQKGFGKYYFNKLNLIYTENKNGITKSYINSKKAISKAKLLFNCNNIKGIELENQGGTGSAGSHWNQDIC